ncbi:MAG: RIP metalloprotease RseP [Gammaproteobacteria bacterium]
MLNIITAILAIILTLLIVVGFHEFGHFILARLCGVTVKRFSIGFGKKLWGVKDAKKTEYVIAAIPLGGYVKMLDGREDTITKDEEPRAFDHQAWYKKALIIAAGPIFNFILAIFFFWILFTAGFHTIVPVIGNVSQDSIAAKAKLQPMEQIVAINHQTVRSWRSVIMALIEAYGDDSLTITVVPFGKETKEIKTLHTKNWTLDPLSPDLVASLGIRHYQPPTDAKNWPADMRQLIQFPFYYALIPALQETWRLSIFTCISLWKIITGKISIQALGGPITIAEFAARTLIHSLNAFIGFLALISINLGIVNLLPLPALDGGQFIYAIVEGIIRRPLSLRFQLLFYRIGVIFIFLLLVQVLINDFLRLRA